MEMQDILTNHIFFTAHHNWEWVVVEAIEKYAQNKSMVTKQVRLFKQLPSSCGSKPTYSLFRFDIFLETNICHCVHASGIAFSFLDAKDELFRYCEKFGLCQFMPKTTLIDWDCDDINWIDKQFVPPVLLKASLGSGGFGIYFVNNSVDVLEVIRSHRRRALETKGFIESLQRDHNGHIPSWSLQQLVHVKRIGGRKTQIRVYVIECRGRLFLYKQFEVRLPEWDDEEEKKDDEKIRWSNEVENDCVGNGYARPYNEGRRKDKTMRIIIEELSEGGDMMDLVRNCVISFFHGLFPAISQHLLINNNKNTDNNMMMMMSVCGVDLLVDEETQHCYIVEINHNPAMANPEKHQMSDKYRTHLVSFVTGLLHLGITIDHPDPHEDFTEII